MPSNPKGNRGEHQAAEKISEIFGVVAGKGSNKDMIHGLKGVHIEVKRTEKIRLKEHLKQAEDDAGKDIPVVMHRYNHSPWVWIVQVEDMPRLAQIIHEEINGNQSEASFKVPAGPEDD